MSRVNLDALIPREDFDAEESLNPVRKKDTLSIDDLKPDSFFYPVLRKPDFQRETNEWTSKKIVDFIASFVNGDLIPAIILWRSNSGSFFVIDGSHRLSALAAWINDDYGDGRISKRFYDEIIPEDQLKVADTTRRLINKNIGCYEDYALAKSYPTRVKPEIVVKSKDFGALAIQLQWVEGDASKAENSFFKINQQAAPINSTELTLLESRKKPNCIAARAIIRGGKGHKYWSKFTEENQTQIQSLAKDIHTVLFDPQITTPVKTLDIPIGGRLFSAQTLSLVLDFVNLVNDVKPGKNSLNEDEDGSQTILMMKKVMKTANRINSLHPSSLGLHPIVYFYSQEGKYKITSFYAIVALILELDKTSKFNDFTTIRECFETILLKYDVLVQQINRKHRSSMDSYPHILTYYLAIIDCLMKGLSIQDTINQVMKEDEFKYLTFNNTEEASNAQDFSTDKKSAVFIRSALTSAPRCTICNGLIHRNSITIDHIERKQDGGLGNTDNGQIAHPYCNTTYKN